MNLKINFLITVFIFSYFCISFSKFPLRNTNDQILVEYKVQIGDTLWEIGQKMKAVNYEKFIFDVKMLNDLENSLINVDDILIVPYNT
jgi:hypothetical protein